MRRVRRYRGLVLGLLFLAAVAVGLWQKQAIFDWTRLRNYTPPANIKALADQTAMSDHGRKIFYVQHPSLEDRTKFSDHCQATEQTIVLGCYVSRGGIYIFEVPDARLDGIEQVTAAHEMLHAAYDRMSRAQKDRVGELLTKAYENITDERIRDVVRSYQQSGADITNELHSILGTEVRDLPAELEAHYRQYFADRLQVVGFSEAYEQVFTQRQSQVDTFDSQLENLKQQVDDNQAVLTQRLAELRRDRERLDQQLADRDYASYNAGVSAYNTKVNSYNALVVATRELIDEYNRILAERNAIALEEQELYKAIDSRPQTTDGT